MTRNTRFHLFLASDNIHTVYLKLEVPSFIWLTPLLSVILVSFFTDFSSSFSSIPSSLETSSSSSPSSIIILLSLCPIVAASSSPSEEIERKLSKEDLKSLVGRLL